MQDWRRWWRGRHVIHLAFTKRLIILLLFFFSLFYLFLEFSIGILFSLIFNLMHDCLLYNNTDNLFILKIFFPEIERIKKFLPLGWDFICVESSCRQIKTNWFLLFDLIDDWFVFNWFLFLISKEVFNFPEKAILLFLLFNILQLFFLYFLILFHRWRGIFNFEFHDVCVVLISIH